MLWALVDKVDELEREKRALMSSARSPFMQEDEEKFVRSVGAFERLCNEQVRCLATLAFLSFLGVLQGTQAHALAALRSILRTHANEDEDQGEDGDGDRDATAAAFLSANNKTLP